MEDFGKDIEDIIKQHNIQIDKALAEEEEKKEEQKEDEEQKLEQKPAELNLKDQEEPEEVLEKVEEEKKTEEKEESVEVNKPFRIYLNHLSMDLPKGQEFVKNPLHKDFWDAVDNQQGLFEL